MYIVKVDSLDGDGLSIRCEDMKKVLSATEFLLLHNNRVVVEKQQEPMYLISYTWHLLSNNFKTEAVPESRRWTRVHELETQGYRVLPPEPIDEEEE